MRPEQQVDLLRAACCVAGSDSEITPAERKLIDKLARDIGVGTASVNAMIDRAKRDPAFYQAQFEVLNDEPKSAIVTLVNLVLADGKIDPAEVNVLRGLARNLKIADKVFDGLMKKVHAQIDGTAGD